MKILVAKWRAYLVEDIIKEFKARGHIVSTVQFEMTGYVMKSEDIVRIEEHVQKECPDFVFSMNFFQEISDICQRDKIKYLCWTYDAPCINVYDASALNKCNYIFLFDDAVREDLVNAGVKNAYYLPLAVNNTFSQQIELSEADKEKYTTDISFVGSTYEEKCGLYNQCEGVLDPYILGYFEGVMEAQRKLDGNFILREMMTPEIEKYILESMNFDLGERYLLSKIDFFVYFFLGQKSTALQRKFILQWIANHYQLDLYTEMVPKDFSGNLKLHPHIDYSELGKIYRTSKVNLNFTMPNIREGIPLRVMDILGSGGFLITNYRKALCDVFEDGKDLVVYYDEYDLLQKIDYYLSHEEERIRIAENGRRKVLSQHSLSIKIDFMLAKL